MSSACSDAGRRNVADFHFADIDTTVLETKQSCEFRHVLTYAGALGQGTVETFVQGVAKFVQRVPKVIVMRRRMESSPDALDFCTKDVRVGTFTSHAREIVLERVHEFRHFFEIDTRSACGIHGVFPFAQRPGRCRERRIG